MSHGDIFGNGIARTLTPETPNFISVHREGTFFIHIAPFFLVFNSIFCDPAVVNASLTESTLKTVPQVVNVQELKDKGPPVAVPNMR